MIRIDPDDAGVELMLGVYYAKTKNRSESKKYLASGKEKLKTIGDSLLFGDLTRTQQLYFKESLIDFYLLKKERFPEEAEAVLMIGEDYFVEEREDCYIENKEDFLKVYNTIVG